MTDSIHDLLLSLDLSEKEASMYVALLRSGAQPTSVLARKAGLNRSTAYVILQALLRRGLASKTMKKKIQYFAPLDPGELLHYIDHRRQDLLEKKEHVQTMMGRLHALVNPMSTKPKIEFFDGTEGARRVLNDTLTSTEKTLRAFLSIADIADFLGSKFFNEYTTERVAKGYTLHAIRTHEKDKRAVEIDPHAKRYISSRKEKREIRHASEDLAFPMTIYMYDSKIAVISSKEENFALLIESQEMADMLKKLFELLWSALPK